MLTYVLSHTTHPPDYALEVKRQSHGVAVLSVCLATQMSSFLFAFKADENVPPTTQTDVYQETYTSTSKLCCSVRRQVSNRAWERFVYMWKWE